MEKYSRGSLRFLILALVVTFCAGCLTGRSYSGDPPPLVAEEVEIRDHLRAHVFKLAADIGERNWASYDALERARQYIEAQFRGFGYDAKSRPFLFRGETFYNVEAVLHGPTDTGGDIVIGAHYDSVEGSPGANDNASGVAVLLELARLLYDEQHAATVRFVAFANEEPPYFNTGEGMGSVEYVRSLQDPVDSVRCMLALETVGFFSDEPGSQQYPPLGRLLYPDRGNFIGFVGDLRSRGLVRQVLRSFRRTATVPSEGAALPAWVPGVSWSDHRSFREAGIPALMITDTALFRDPEYHTASDTPERLDYEKMTRLVMGLARIAEDLADLEA